MKVRNVKTNNVFNLPKNEVEALIENNPDLYEKLTRKIQKNRVIIPKFEQNTILPLIWDNN